VWRRAERRKENGEDSSHSREPRSFWLWILGEARRGGFWGPDGCRLRNRAGIKRFEKGSKKRPRLRSVSHGGKSQGGDLRWVQVKITLSLLGGRLMHTFRHIFLGVPEGVRGGKECSP